MEPHLTDISRVIQLAVAPVFLLTAIATLINTLNGRLGRIVDRRRTLFGRSGEADAAIEAELALLERRSRLVYQAIFYAVLSALLVCLVVASAFVAALVASDLSRLVAGLFIVSMLTMVLALGLFLREVHLAVQTGTHRNP